jgi:hypothetical protein
LDGLPQGRVFVLWTMLRLKILDRNRAAPAFLLRRGMTID